MSPEEALSLKLLSTKFAEATMQLEHAIKLSEYELNRALKSRDEARENLYSKIDELTVRK